MRDKADAETIAKGLSPARRRAVLVISGAFDMPPRGHAQWLSTMSNKLVQWRYSGKGHREYRLTPLGLAVRAILKGE
jgi:hypothetical protein